MVGGVLRGPSEMGILPLFPRRSLRKSRLAIRHIVKMSPLVPDFFPFVPSEARETSQRNSKFICVNHPCPGLLTPLCLPVSHVF